MTPKQAIKAECIACGLKRGEKCHSRICELRNATIPPVKRIKAHCLTCVETITEVRDCTGKTVKGDCALHPFRFGKNPARQAASVKSAKGNTKLSEFRFKGGVSP